MRFAKEFKKGFLGLTAGYLIVGVVLLCYPALMPSLLCYALGAFAVVLGIVYIAAYFSRRVLTEYYRIDFSIGAALVLFGIDTLIFPEVFGGRLNLILGLAIVFDSLLKVQNAIDLQRLGNRLWWAVLLLSLLSLVLGGLLLWDVRFPQMEPMRFVGLCLVVDGCVNLWSYFVLLYALRKHRKLHPDGALPVPAASAAQVLRPEDAPDEKLMARVQQAIEKFSGHADVTDASVQQETTDTPDEQAAADAATPQDATPEAPQDAPQEATCK